MIKENNLARWEHFEHGADIGVRGFGKTPGQAFEQCAVALSSVITNIESVNALECLSVACQGDDIDFLLVDWLNELIYLMATRNMLFKSFAVEISNDGLNAKVCGEAVDITRHKPAVEIKGATLTELKVEQLNDVWLAQCIVDV